MSSAANFVGLATLAFRLRLLCVSWDEITVVPDRSKYSGGVPVLVLIAGIDQRGSMDHSEPPSTTSGHGSTAPVVPVGVRSKVVPAGGAGSEFRLQPDFNWTRSLSERVRGMRDSALGVVWKKRREQKLRGMPSLQTQSCGRASQCPLHSSTCV